MKATALQNILETAEPVDKKYRVCCGDTVYYMIDGSDGERRNELLRQMALLFQRRERRRLHPAGRGAATGTRDSEEEADNGNLQRRLLTRQTTSHGWQEKPPTAK